jgi:serine/threonine protein kinase
MASYRDVRGNGIMMIDYTGQQIGSYRLVRRLGMGGFASVYLGQHVRIATQQAAIKLLHLFDVDAKKFQQEAETMAALVHPHIIRLFDFDFHDQMPFLVIEYAPGGSLRTRYPAGTLIPLPSIVQYVQQIAEALEYAHGKNVIHRDIKPDNILIGAQGELRLSDFGIAVLSQTGRNSLGVSSGVRGTAYYMAPEQSRGKPEKASDQYALAIMVYEWLCGKPPFTEGNAINIQYQHVHEPVPPLGEQLPTLLPAVEQVIMHALTKDHKGRFASVKDFAQALKLACSDTAAVSIHSLPSIPPSEVSSEVPPAGNLSDGIDDHSASISGNGTAPQVGVNQASQVIYHLPTDKIHSELSGVVAAIPVRSPITPILPIFVRQSNTGETPLIADASVASSVEHHASISYPPINSRDLAQTRAPRAKRRWGGPIMAILIFAAVLISGGIAISSLVLHQFYFGQSPSSNATLTTVTSSHTSSTTATITLHSSMGKIFDEVGVLNQSQVKNAEASLRYPVDIYTTDSFSGTNSQFEQRAHAHLTSPDLIVMAICMNPHHVTVVAGNRVPLSNAEADNVINSFRQGYQSSGSNFTSATVSALQSLQHALEIGSAG